MTPEIDFNTTAMCQWTGPECQETCLSVTDRASGTFRAYEIASYTIAVAALMVKCAYVMRRRFCREEQPLLYESRPNEYLMLEDGSEPQPSPSYTTGRAYRLIGIVDRHLPVGTALAFATGATMTAARSVLDPARCAETADYCLVLCETFLNNIFDNLG